MAEGMDEGKLFAYLLSEKLCSKINDTRSPSNDATNESIFLSTAEAWFDKLAKLGCVTEIFKCMESAMEIFNTNKAELLCITARVLGKNGLCLEATKLYRLALKSSLNNLNIHEDLEQCYNYCLERWHFRMLNDMKRNSSYFKAVKKAVNSGYKNVIDIGSGTGILSLFAASCGATKILACEKSETMAEISKAIVSETNFQNQISILNKMSTDIIVGDDIDSKFSLVVTEIFDCALLGEGIIPTLKHAWKNLLDHADNHTSSEQMPLKPKIIPLRARVYALLIESVELRKHARSKPFLNGFDLTDVIILGKKDPEDVSEQPYTTESLRYLKGGYKPLSQPMEILDVNFNDVNEVQMITTKKCMIEMPIIQDGVVDAVAVWFELQLDDEINISSSPEADSCWEQAIYILQTEDKQAVDPIPLLKGSTIKLSCSFDERYLQIFVHDISCKGCSSRVIDVNIDCLSAKSDKSSPPPVISCWPSIYRNEYNQEHLFHLQEQVDSTENSLGLYDAEVWNNFRLTEAHQMTEKDAISDKNASIINPYDNVKVNKSDNIPNQESTAYQEELNASKTPREVSPSVNKYHQKFCLSANRRKVARLNDEEYLNLYQKAISLAIQTKEMTNCNKRIDVLCLFDELSLIPLLIPQKNDVNVVVLSCDEDARLLLENIARCNGISLKNYSFIDASLVDVVAHASKFDLVVMEIVNEDGLLKQRLFDDVILIRTFLLKEDGILLPRNFSVHGVVLESSKLDKDNFVTGTDETMGFEIGKFINKYRVFTQPDIDLFTLPCVRISEQFNLFEIDLLEGSYSEDIEKLAAPKKSKILIEAVNNGSLSAVCYWFSVVLYGNHSIDTTCRHTTHWHQACALFDEDSNVENDDMITVDFVMNRSNIHIIETEVKR